MMDTTKRENIKFRVWHGREDRKKKLLRVAMEYVGKSAICEQELIEHIGVASSQTLRKYLSEIEPNMKLSVGHDSDGRRWVSFDWRHK